MHIIGWVVIAFEVRIWNFVRYPVKFCMVLWYYFYLSNSIFRKLFFLWPFNLFSKPPWHECNYLDKFKYITSFGNICDQALLKWGCFTIAQGYSLLCSGLIPEFIPILATPNLLSTLIGTFIQRRVVYSMWITFYFFILFIELLLFIY